MSVHQLLYFSKALPHIGIKDVEEILEKAHQFNAEHELTGVLIFHSGIFLQLLEGEKAEVEGLFAKIRADRRHKNVLRFLERTADLRIFPDWSMAYCSLNEFDPSIVSQIMLWNRLINEGGKVEDKEITTVLNRFKSALKPPSEPAPLT